MSSKWDKVGGSSAAWRRQRARVLQRDQYMCQIAGPKCTGKATHCDHKKPWTPGVPVRDADLQAACATCNTSVGAPEGRITEVERPRWLQ